MREAHRIALLFPGQGAHALTMFDGLTDCPSFAERHAYIVARLGIDPLRRPDAAELINTNQVSSLFTVLASSLALDLLRAQGIRPSALAGYSVGQWTALYAADVVSFEQLVDIVHARAAFMDDCVAGRRGAMLAVIGLPLQAVEEVCQGLRAEGCFLAVSNYNCIGQWSLSGDLAAVERAIPRLAAMQPKKIQRLPVAGAWHCALLADAERRFLAFLEGLPLGRPSLPVCDNAARPTPAFSCPSMNGRRSRRSIGRCRTPLVSPIRRWLAVCCRPVVAVKRVCNGTLRYSTRHSSTGRRSSADS